MERFTWKSFHLQIYGRTVADPSGPPLGHGKPGAKPVGAHEHHHRTLHPQVFAGVNVARFDCARKGRANGRVAKLFLRELLARFI